MNYMFDGMGHLENITFGEKFDTSKVTDMHGMFNSLCESKIIGFK